MRLKQLRLTDFKNHASRDFSFEKEIVAFCGKNGVGKTNILDAIHLLCMCRTYFGSSETSAIKHGAQWYAVYAKVELPDGTHEVACMVDRNTGKVFRWDKEDYTRLSEHLGKMPVVVIAPGDIALINEGSEPRRKWMDAFISQTDKIYLHNLSAYHRLQEQRNNLLKQFALKGFVENVLLDAIDSQMPPHIKVIYETRKEFISAFLPLFREHHNNLSGNEEEAALSYLSDLHDIDPREIISSNRERDLELTRTEKGPHRDDLLFALNGYPIKKFGSQGQVKTYLIALKLAQFDYLKAKTGIKPFLLLDDIFEKLDEYRAERLMLMVAQEHFGQIFITDTHRQRLEAIFAETGQSPQIFSI